MSEKQFSIIILTFNEALHLPRLLASCAGLNCDLFILDSGSTDETLAIAARHNATVLVHPFENHPKQWHYALTHFNIQTPWVVGLDADHVLEPELYAQLAQFKDAEMASDVDGIYFNRKNYFKGRWIKHGGYFPKYLLKMFRYGKGQSDLNENMDHRFVVPGKTVVWSKGYLKEENLKENDINFWLSKHLKYSDLVAQEEVERMQKLRIQSVKPHFWGSPDQRIAFLKKIWWGLPLYWRPIVYFTYRFIFKLGFLDGKEGRLFHFLQGFWFRLIVDEKIDTLLQQQNEKR